MLIFLLLILLLPLSLHAQTRLNDIETRLRDALVQEKVYLHLDNNCYFKGDTIWYKSYVVRADNLQYTDMSRLVYVELVNPDGLVVERQTLIATAQGVGDGNFVLRDSLYSGYYELRAYTRWMLNFCVTQHPFMRHHLERFYNHEVAAEFFREYGALSSRVVPVYDCPDDPGAYDLRFMTPRKKMRNPEPPKEKLQVSFYPEGGQLLRGTRCRVAWEATDEQGQAVSVQGSVTAGGQSQPIATTYMGRGDFMLDVPQQGSAKATLRYKDRDYHFSLPDAVATGCALSVTHQSDSLTAQLSLRGLPAADTLGVAVLCRGRLLGFQTVVVGEGQHTLYFPYSQLATGVNDVVVMDAEGRKMADRLTFVDKQDYPQRTIRLRNPEFQLQPLEPVTLTLDAPADAHHLSISVRDCKTDEHTYDNGTLLTDLLLGSELQGFVADPQHYFADTTPETRLHLDQLLLVQGWRRYDYASMLAMQSPQYQPELCLSVEGDVFKTVDFTDSQTAFAAAMMNADNDALITSIVSNDTSSVQVFLEGGSTFNYGVNHKRLKHEVTVEGELILTDEVGDVAIETVNQGHYTFEIPGYFGQGVLFMSAHKTNASQRHQKRMAHKGRQDEGAWPDFYVKRSLHHPVFARRYNYYEEHLPEVRDRDDEDDRFWWLTPGQQMVRISSMDAVLDNVEVRANRHSGLRRVELDQPVCTIDAYELYNLITDRGLSYGKFNYNRFAADICTALFGSYDATSQFPRIQTRMDNSVTEDDTFRPDDPFNIESEKMSDFTKINNMQLKRIDSIQVYTDFNLRRYDDYLERGWRQWDVLIRYKMLPEGSQRYTYRDRRIQLPGIYQPAQFYHPDYSRRPLPLGQKDYRRTLYWNANAPVDADGRCTVTFYNNSTARDLRISVAGLTDEGKPVVMEAHMKPLSPALPPSGGRE